MRNIQDISGLQFLQQMKTDLEPSLQDTVDEIVERLINNSSKMSAPSDKMNGSSRSAANSALASHHSHASQHSSMHLMNSFAAESLHSIRNREPLYTKGKQKCKEMCFFFENVI